MKLEREYPRITVTKKAQASLNGGHPWVYDTEITDANGGTPPDNGAFVDVLGGKGEYLGTGIYSKHSKIRVRLLSRSANDRFDERFFRRGIEYAWRYRKTVMGDDISACRVIFGEADRFPGLTIDRFGDIPVTQTLSYGMERLKPMIFPLLYDVLTADGCRINGIYERNDVQLRELEGLAEGKGWFELEGLTRPDSTVTEITENGIRYRVNFENGQKTGFFLDQKYNRLAVAKIARGKRVLDCFTHTGSFALNAAMGGAEHVTAVDISEDALETARRNIALNGMDGRIDTLAADVFNLLPALTQRGSSPYDLIILDPPAFTKSRKTVDSASRGYKEINYRAMKLLPRGGYLATCSCSHFMPDELFLKLIRSAASDAAVELRRVESRQQAPDHPALMNVPETDYLKFHIFQVV